MGRSHIRSRRNADPSGYGFAPAEVPNPLDPTHLFGDPAKTAPLEIEVGSGKGTFLVAEGEARPETLFLGIERARRYWLFAADRLRRRERDNARILRADANEALAALPPASAAGVHVYFPDPWPKRRHAHRRLLVNADFLAAVERVLRPGGLLRVVSDAPDYFAAIRETLATRRNLVPCPYEPPASAGDGELAGSNFERKYLVEGRPIQALAARRVESPPEALGDTPERD